MTDPDKLPDDIVALLRDADRADVVSAATRRAAWTRIEATLGGAAASTVFSAAATSMTRVGLVLVVVATVAVAVAAGLGVFRGAPAAITVDHAAAVAPTATPATVAPPTIAHVLPPPTTSPPSPTRSPTRPDADRERGIIEEARTRLARNDLAGASAALDNHRRRYTRGALVEDRDALAVLLAWRRGDADAASIDAAFRRQYPHSLYTAAIARQQAQAGGGP